MPNSNEPVLADEKVTESTRATEADDELQHARADRPPTADEEAIADAQPPLDDDVAETYKKQADVGAAVEGEGKISS